MTPRKARLLLFLLSAVLFLSVDGNGQTARPAHWRDVLAELRGYATNAERALDEGETEQARWLVGEIRRVVDIELSEGES